MWLLCTVRLGKDVRAWSSFVSVRDRGVVVVHRVGSWYGKGGKDRQRDRKEEGGGREDGEERTDREIGRGKGEIERQKGGKGRKAHKRECELRHKSTKGGMMRPTEKETIGARVCVLVPHSHVFKSSQLSFRIRHRPCSVSFTIIALHLPSSFALFCLCESTIKKCSLMISQRKSVCLVSSRVSHGVSSK